MLPDPLETLRHELAATLARRPDLAELEAQAVSVLQAARERHEQLVQERKRIRQDRSDWIINGGGGVLATAGLARMITVGEVGLLELTVGGGGSLLTLWGASRFRQKVLAERGLRRRIDRLTEYVLNLGEARRRIRQARRLQMAPKDGG
jgi:hypothetical protein